MLLFPLDSVRAARPEDGTQTPKHKLESIANALKACIIRGDTVDFGEPQIIDNTFILENLKDDNFFKVLSEIPVRLCMRKEKRIFLTPRQAFLLRIDSGWHPSAWRFEKSEKLVRDLGKNITPKQINATEKEYLKSLKKMDRIVDKRRKYWYHADYPQEKYVLSRLLRNTANRLTYASDSLQESDPRYYASAACISAGKKIKKALRDLTPLNKQNDRTELLRHVVDDSNPLKLADELDEWIAQTAIHIAYNYTLASSWGSDQVWDSDYYFVSNEKVISSLTEYYDLLAPTTYWKPIQLVSAMAETDISRKKTKTLKGKTLNEISWGDINNLVQCEHYKYLVATKCQETKPERYNELTYEIVDYASDMLGGILYEAQAPSILNLEMLFYCEAARFIEENPAIRETCIQFGESGWLIQHTTAGLVASKPVIHSGIKYAHWKLRKDKILEKLHGAIRTESLGTKLYYRKNK